MEARTDNTIVVIPSYNEARAIGGIVSHIVGLGMSALIIDDGSVDTTERVALDNGAIVIRNRKNKGKGFCVREGIKHVLKKTNFEWMIIMDGDGQHHVEDISVLLTAMNKDSADIINGNRMMETKDMPVVRYWTNRFTSWVVSKLCGQYIPDTQCGYRLIRVEALRELKLTSDKYDIESEMLIQAAQKGMRIDSVSIQTIYGEETSEINKIRDTFKFFSLIIKHIIERNGK